MAAGSTALLRLSTPRPCIPPTLTSSRLLSLNPKPHFVCANRSSRLSIAASAAVMQAPEVPSVVLPGMNVDEDDALPRGLQFVKYHGLGNDFIMVDNRDSVEPKVSPKQAVKLCDRNFGVGADGVIFVLPGTNGAEYTMRIFNSDGSEPEMCGNGVRCFAKFIAELENIQGERSFSVHTGAGLIVPELQNNGQVKVDMGQPVLSAPDIPTKLSASQNGAVVGVDLLVDSITWCVTCVSMGNPHCVIFARTDSQPLQVDDMDLASIGPKFEHHQMFPSRTNTEFVQVLSRSHLKMRVWERGAGATLACGTGACAVVVAAVLEGRSERKCVVDLPGGPLEIEWKVDNNHVYMTGPAQAVFYGSTAH